MSKSADIFEIKNFIDSQIVRKKETFVCISRIKFRKSKAFQDIFDVKKNITLYKTYHSDIVSPIEGYIFIEDDHGGFGYYDERNFVTLAKYRKMKLKKINKQ